MSNSMYKDMEDRDKKVNSNIGNDKYWAGYHTAVVDVWLGYNTEDRMVGNKDKKEWERGYLDGLRNARKYIS